MPLNYEQLEAIVGILRDTPPLTEIEVRHTPAGAPPVTLRLRRPPTARRSGGGGGGSSAGAAAGSVATSKGNNGGSRAATAGANGGGGGGAGTRSARAGEGGDASAAASAPATGAAAAGIGLPDRVNIIAGLVGIFRALPPEKRVTAGDPVQNGQVLGRIESMRLLTDCLANADGVIGAVLVQDGQPVEYGQPLFEVRPREGADE